MEELRFLDRRLWSNRMYKFRYRRHKWDPYRECWDPETYIHTRSESLSELQRQVELNAGKGAWR